MPTSHVARRNRHFTPIEAEEQNSSSACLLALQSAYISHIYTLQYANIKLLSYGACLAVIENCGTDFLLLHEILVVRHRFI